jgi:thiol-disulfide isomerase/thioredoxin
MKKNFLVVLMLICLNNVFAQSPYISLKDENHPEQHILNGIITKYALQNDSTYKWFTSSQNSYTPAEAMVNALVGAKNKMQFVIFGGTWCEDTQFILPKFFKLQEQAGFPDAGVSLFAVDRNKKTIGGITDAFKVSNVPTIIVMKDGKEVGRVVEYGKTGQWDKELAELLK